MTSFDDVPADLLDELRSAGLDPERVWRILAGAIEEDVPDARLDDPTSRSTVRRTFAARRCSRRASPGSSPASGSPP